MSKFIFLYSGGGMPKDPAAAQSQMAAWMAYYARIQASLADGGAPFVPGGKLLGSASTSKATGFTLVQADSLEQAVALTKGHPQLINGGGIEVLECVDMTAMQQQVAHPS